MKLSNSIKLSIANFSLFWKILVYKLISLGIIVLLLLPVFNTLKVCLINSGFWSASQTVLSSAVFESLSQMSLNLFACFECLIDAVIILSSTSTLTLIYIAFIVFILAPFILKLSDVPTSESVYNYMASLSKNSYTVNFIDKLNKSTGYSILKTLLEVPFWACFLAGLYGLLSLSIVNQGLLILCPMFVFVFVVFMMDIKTTLLSGWSSSIVVFNVSVGKAFRKGICAVKRKFLSTLSSFAVISTIFVAVLCMFGLYSLIVLIPLWSLLKNVFGQVLFFESQGMNYYISPDRIINPRKLEQADSIKKVKSII